MKLPLKPQVNVTDVFDAIRQWNASRRRKRPNTTVWINKRNYRLSVTNGRERQPANTEALISVKTYDRPLTTRDVQYAAEMFINKSIKNKGAGTHAE